MSRKGTGYNVAALARGEIKRSMKSKKEETVPEHTRERGTGLINAEGSGKWRKWKEEGTKWQDEKL